MTEAETALADLDAALDEFGEVVMLQRLTLGPGGTQIPYEATCRAIVRQYQPHELVEGIIQGDSMVILSPSPLARAQWPGPGLDPLPRKNDRIIVRGKPRNIEAVVPYPVGGQMARIESQTRGRS